MSDLYLRFTGHDEIAELLERSDEDVLVALGKPTLIRIPGTDRLPAARAVVALLHGNEDSGYRAVLEWLRTGERCPYDVWVFIGNVRAAHQEGWFAHRYLDGQEDFNRVWGLAAPTTRMRRCADEVFEELSRQPLEAILDIHNNTGDNPYYAVVPVTTRESLHLASLIADTALLWGLRAHTLMEAFLDRCPAVAVECGLPGMPANTAFAGKALRAFLAADGLEEGRGVPERVFEILHRVTVRPEVPFAFGGQLSDEVDFVLHPGLDGANFGMLLAGTELGVVAPGTAMPLCATSMRAEDVTDRYFRATKDGRVVLTEDITPAMMVTTERQARRDCLFYVARRRA